MVYAAAAASGDGEASSLSAHELDQLYWRAVNAEREKVATSHA